jgi:ubiquinone/menaquinone biosynthesis C-methylase UbiE
MPARVLEPEVMDTPEDASDYDAMDHSAVNQRFAADFFLTCPNPGGVVLDVGTGTAQIPVEMCRQSPTVELVAVDLSAEMLKLAAGNVARAGVTSRVKVELVNARGLPYRDGEFAAVVSNSIIHHIPEPFTAFAEMHRVCRKDGTLFVRDLFRPDTDAELARLVNLYAAGANPHQRSLFTDSLRAALTVAEVQELVGRLGFPPVTVTATSDRHWTFVGRR